MLPYDTDSSAWRNCWFNSQIKRIFLSFAIYSSHYQFLVVHRIHSWDQLYFCCSHCFAPSFFFKKQNILLLFSLCVIFANTHFVCVWVSVCLLFVAFVNFTMSPHRWEQRNLGYKGKSINQSYAESYSILFFILFLSFKLIQVKQRSNVSKSSKHTHNSQP